MAPTTRHQRAERALRLTHLPPDLLGRVLRHLDSVADLAAANGASRLLGTPVEHALRERANARGHARALPASLPSGARTWKGELFARERVLQLARAHACVVAAGAGCPDGPSFSAFVDADGAVHACGEASFDERERGIRTCPLATGLCEALHAEPSGGSGVPSPARVPSLSSVRVRSVAAGDEHLLALSDAGTVYACGANRYGQLGLGDEEGVDTFAFAPVRGLSSEVVVGIAAKLDHSLALTAAGCAYSWGNNGHGQLGHGDTERRYEPTRIEALDGVRVGGVAAGADHTLLLTARATVYSCGAGSDGQLGHGNCQHQLTPRRIEALAGVRAVHVSAGAEHSLVVDAAGKVYSFGVPRARSCRSNRGRPLKHLLAPRRVDGLGRVRAVRVCAGSSCSAVVGADGSVHTFGTNDLGRLGLGTSTEQRPDPTLVEALGHARVVSCVFGETHTLFVTADGSVYSCGERSAALGLGVTSAEPDEDSGELSSWDDDDDDEAVPEPTLVPDMLLLMVAD